MSTGPPAPTSPRISQTAASSSASRKSHPSSLIPARPYFCSPHVTKGQSHNMPLLRRILETRCTLIDYERIVDRFGRRLIFLAGTRATPA